MTRTVLVMCCVLAVGCSLKTKQALTQGDAVAYQSQQAIADLETVLSQAGTIPRDKSLEIYRILKPGADIGLEATHVLQMWRPGEPMPAQLPGLVSALWKLTQQIIALLPKDSQSQALQTKAAVNRSAETIDQQLAHLDALWRQLQGQIAARLKVLGG